MWGKRQGDQQANQTGVAWENSEESPFLPTGQKRKKNISYWKTQHGREKQNEQREGT